MKKLLGFLVGIGLGMASGYVAGLLLTPASGEDLQTQVRSRINLALEEGKRAASVRRIRITGAVQRRQAHAIGLRINVGTVGTNEVCRLMTTRTMAVLQCGQGWPVRRKTWWRFWFCPFAPPGRW